MPKIFTDEEKEGHRAILLDQGLGLIMKNGYKNVTIDQLVQLIGASKGYFYVLFPSKEQFFLQAIASQMERHFDALREVMERHPSPKEIGEAYRLFESRQDGAFYCKRGYKFGPPLKKWGECKIV